MATIYDKILSGDLPSYKVYEDEHVYSFLDINPIAFGHTLVIPREPRAFLHELSDESAAALGRALRLVALRCVVLDPRFLPSGGRGRGRGGVVVRL